MLGKVRAHWVLPYKYNTEEVIRTWFKANNVHVAPYESITWETVGLNGDRTLVKGEGHNHVYILSQQGISNYKGYDE